MREGVGSEEVEDWDGVENGESDGDDLVWLSQLDEQSSSRRREGEYNGNRD